MYLYNFFKLNIFHIFIKTDVRPEEAENSRRNKLTSGKQSSKSNYSILCSWLNLESKLILIKNLCVDSYLPKKNILLRKYNNQAVQ